MSEEKPDQVHHEEVPEQEVSPTRQYHASSFAVLKRIDGDEEVDATTGATPGVSSACKEYGLEDMETVMKTRNIKPPGVS